MIDELKHYGILGQKWGIRRFQNYDGTLTDAGKARPGYVRTPRELKKEAKKDSKWANKNYKTLYKKAFKESQPELKQYMRGVEQVMNAYNANGKLSSNYINAYNRKLAELMNESTSEIAAPSGKVVQWVAKRGDVGVMMALADAGYDMQQVKNGVYTTGRVAYRKNEIEKI